MIHKLTPELIALLTHWATRPDASTDLRNIFGVESHQSESLLQSIRAGDFSWIPEIQILPAASMEIVYGAYARETGAIYLSEDCPSDLVTAVLLEEIGHHIDALFNEQETPGDEGALFSAVVRGISLSDEEITALLNEDDSAVLLLNEQQVTVECASRNPAPTPRAPLKPIITVVPGSSNLKNSNDWDTLTSGTATLTSGKHGLSLVGSQALVGYGNSGTEGTNASTNTLTAASNSGDSVLYAGKAATTMIGGSGNTTLYGSTANKTDSIIGGTGSSTIVAGNGLATLVGGSKNNSIVAGTSLGRTLGQSLWGGNNNGSSLNGNTLRGGSGKDTLRSGTGFNTLISGSNPGVSTTIAAIAKMGDTSIIIANTSGLAVGQQIMGNGIAAGTTITAIAGTKLTLSAITTASIAAGTLINTFGNNLIGGGVSNSLVAGLGNDSLTALSGNSTLRGGTGKTTMLSGTGTNLLLSGSAAGLPGNGNLLNASLGTSNTLVAGLGRDTLIGGDRQNLLLVNQANLAAFAADSISLSTLPSASNTLGVSSTTPVTVSDALFATMATANVTNLGTVANLGTTSQIILGTNAEKVGVHTLVAGLGSDALSVAGYATNSALLDGSKSVNRVSLIGGGTGNDTFFGSKGGYDTMTGAAGNDSFVIQASALAGSSFGHINGNGGTDSLLLNTAASLSGTSFNSVSNIEVLQLGNGNNSVGSLQGSGIQKIVGNTGSDTLSANVYGAVKSVTLANAPSVTLNVSPGTSPTMGFAVGQVVTGNGIAVGTTITGISSSPGVGATPGTVTLILSKSTTSLISQGGAITGWLNGATLDGSAGYGLAPTDATKSQASTFINNAISSITAANYGIPNEAAIDTSLISALQYNPNSYIHRKGDFLTGLGQNQSLAGSNGNSLPTIPFNTFFSPQKGSGNVGGLPNGILINQYQVVDNTLFSGAFASNTLVGGSGANLYLINNLPGTTALPTIQNPTTLQSASTIQLTGNGVILDDPALSTVSARAAQKIVTANGKNLIQIGLNAAQIGIQTITGGIGSDTFTAPVDYTPSVYFDASKNGGNSSLASGNGNDTLLAGTSNATLVGGDGNNSLIGGSGNNLILSGVGNSTLDGGLGVSILQADGGINTFVVRHRDTRILNPFSLERDSLTGQITPPNPAPTATTPEIGIVNSYVNFDPIQSTEVNQFAPDSPDGSPSITKSPSFASKDLSSFFSLQYFNLLGSAVYGVGNALDNTMSSASANALMLGMGGNNTLIGNGDNTSLFGYVNSTYANPDLYAAAPFDTRDQSFIDGVIGAAGNNYLVAHGANSYLDGGPGYNDGIGGLSGSNTLIGTKGGDTFIVRNQADSIVAAAGTNHLLSTVDLHSIADRITTATLLVTTQTPNLPNINPNNPTLPPNSGQTDPATFLGFGNGVPSSNVPNLFSDRELKITVPNSTSLAVQYGTAEGKKFENDGTLSPPDGFSLLIVDQLVSDPNNPGRLQTTLAWNAPATGGKVVGYSVYFRTDDGSGNLGPWKTYVNGTSQDLAGTANMPSLTVDNLPTLPSGQSYDFRVTAQQLTLPTTTDLLGHVTAKPVTLQGSNGNDIIWAQMPAESIFGIFTGYQSNAPILFDNPFGTIIPVPTKPIEGNWDSYPVFMTGQNGNDLYVTQQIGRGDGSDFTVGGVTFTGLHTMVGGIGSDTFYVSNGDTSFNNGVVTTGPKGFDLCIKYGNETPVNYTNFAPSTAAGIGNTGVSLNGGQHNLIVSDLRAIVLSSTVVSQGKFVDQLLVNGAGRYGEGNNLDNFIYNLNSRTSDVGSTLVGNVGRDSIVGIGSNDVLIGGTATGFDSIAGALKDFGNGFMTSIFWDTDPVPTTAIVSGPGKDISQYWTRNGRLGGWVFDGFASSDTLIATDANSSLKGATLDGGAGDDYMIGGIGNDLFFMSSVKSVTSDSLGNLIGSTETGNSGDVVTGGGGDVVTGGGGNDTIVGTASDLFWSGIPGAGTAQVTFSLSSVLQNTKFVGGDSQGGKSISNIILQAGDPIARGAIGSCDSTGNQHKSILGAELGSNVLKGNEFNNTLHGGGVGGGDGKGVGADTLIGGSGANLFKTDGLYTESTSNKAATFTTKDGANPGTSIASISAKRTDADFVVIRNFKDSDTLQLAGGADTTGRWFIGAAPSGFDANNIGGEVSSSATDFGIYRITSTGPNLVAEVQCASGFSLGAATTAQVGGVDVDGTNSNLGGRQTNAGNLTGLSFLGLGNMFELKGSSFASHVIA